MTKKSLFLFTALLIGSLSGSLLYAGGHVKHHDDPLLKTFISNPKQVQDYAFQQSLRALPVWKNFLRQNGQWNVIFNENNALPHRAFGKPISVPGSDTRSTSDNFIQNQLREFNIPTTALEFRSQATNSKFHYVNYMQKYQGLEVLFSQVQVKMTHDYRVSQFALDCFNDITIPTTATISSANAIQLASAGVNGILQVHLSPDLKILPVPGNRVYQHHLVYEITVDNRDAEGIPGKYYTLVDANNGEILYRTNKVLHIVNTDVNVSGTLYLTHPYDPSTVEPMRNMKIVESGNPYFTDDTGFLNLTNTANTTATFSLEGRWVKVRSNAITPSWTVNLVPGANNTNIDANTNIKQRTTYNSVNTVHDYMKSKYPLFTGLDNSLEANVDVAGSCNAFYDGSSINFFAAGGGCNATSLVADVCYHEYGHGINDLFYQSLGYSFDNGAMGEGYADLWALGITGSPILGIGFFDSDPNGFVRRYDINKKVYPQDLIGEVHADGEIIAGCFWDTGINLGNLQQMMDLFKETFYAGISGPAGSEGTLFQDVLLETLTIDDNDGDLTNGTPNYCDITSAFAIHGITLSGAAAVNHTEVLAANVFQPITIQATVQGLGSGSNVKAYYRSGNSGSWSLLAMNNTTGTNYEGIIPGQTGATIIEYYLGIEDDCGTFLNVIPVGADDAVNPNIPYFIMIGYTLNIYEDFDTFYGLWSTGIPSDDATTGQWTVDLPIPSYVGTTQVQPDYQVTPGGIFCALTGNASGPGAGAGENDVDGGKTTLLTPDYDLTSINNAAFTYHRWYSNDQGATPGTDFWQVSISDDGINYVPIENTDVADHSWRRYALRVQDYVSNSSTVSLKFVAEDANAGSLVEALVDDFSLWMGPSGLNQPDALITISMFPNPVTDHLNVNLGLLRDELVAIQVINTVGQTVLEESVQMHQGNNTHILATENLADGIYQVVVRAGSQKMVKKFNIIR